MDGIGWFWMMLSQLGKLVLDSLGSIFYRKIVVLWYIQYNYIYSNHL